MFGHSIYNKNIFHRETQSLQFLAPIFKWRHACVIVSAAVSKI